MSVVFQLQQFRRMLSRASLSTLTCYSTFCSLNPIETIVTTLIIITLAYFQLLQAIKHSEFLDITLPLHNQPNNSPAYPFQPTHTISLIHQPTTTTTHQWNTTTTTTTPHDQQQQTIRLLNFNLAFSYSTRSHSLSTDILSQAAQHITQLIQSTTISDQEEHSISYSDLCFKLNHQPVYPPGSSCFLQIHHHQPSSTIQQPALSLSLAFPINSTPYYPPAIHQRWLDTFLAHLPPTIRLLSPGPTAAAREAHERLGEMRSIRWIAYAARAFVIRFWHLISKADSADIFIMLIAYMLMHLTFLNTFRNMAKLGSTFWLGALTVLSAIFAFILALITAHVLGIRINPILLSEALPFLVITVGFDKPYVLAHAILIRSNWSPSLRRRELVPPARDIVSDSISTVGVRIVRDYAIEITVLGLGAISGINGLTEFCQLAGLSLLYDCLLSFGFYISVLTVFVEIQRIQVVRELAMNDSTTELSKLLDDGVEPSVEVVKEQMAEQESIRAKLIKIFMSDTSPSASGHKSAEKIVIGSSRVKLALLSMFVGLHTLNLCTTLTLRTAITRHSSHPTAFSLDQPGNLSQGTKPSQLTNPLHPELQPDLASMVMGQIKIDPTAPIYASSLERLSKEISLWDDKDSTKTQWIAQLSQPIEMRVARNSRFRQPSPQPGAKSTTSSLVFLDELMSSWTEFVGDPVMSKWIVIVLGLSVLLNAYLLKGIAISTVDQTRRFRHRLSIERARTQAPTSDEDESSENTSDNDHLTPAERAARIMLASTTGGSLSIERLDSPDRNRKDHLAHRRRWSSGLMFTDQKQRPDLMVPDRAEFVTDCSLPKLDPAPEEEILSIRRESQLIKSQTDHLIKPTCQQTSITPTLKGFGAAGDKPVISLSLIDELGRTKDGGITPSEPVSGSTTATNTESNVCDSPLLVDEPTERVVMVLPNRSLEETLDIFNSSDPHLGPSHLTDEEIVVLVQQGKVAAYALEKVLKDFTRAVRIRRALISRASLTKTLENSGLPYLHYDYSLVMGQCCENVVGYIPIPLGIAGPLRIDGTAFPIPMSTTEGALVASTSRGCKALNAGGGVTTVVTADGMTRGPALEFPSLVMAAEAKAWVESEAGRAALKRAFDATSRFARLISLKAALAGRTLFVRFGTRTGDAMGMNMISKGTEAALRLMKSPAHFPHMKVISLSGNYCTDKKPSALNWIEGRGKSVVAEAVVPGSVMEKILKTSVSDIVKLNIAKNLVGSCLAGSIGGNNAHASNVLTAIYLATGQDPAQNVESSNCMTLMEAVNDGKDLLITCTMPSIEVGTIGGGTILGPQAAMLEMLGIRGPNMATPGDNARQLARIICAAVMAGELSLMSALAAGHLVESHMTHNRSVPATPQVQRSPSTSRSASRIGLGPATAMPAATAAASPALGLAAQRTLLPHPSTLHPEPPRP